MRSLLSIYQFLVDNLFFLSAFKRYSSSLLLWNFRCSYLFIDLAWDLLNLLRLSTCVFHGSILGSSQLLSLQILLPRYSFIREPQLNTYWTTQNRGHIKPNLCFEVLRHRDRVNSRHVGTGRLVVRHSQRRHTLPSLQLPAWLLHREPKPNLSSILFSPSGGQVLF